MIEFHTWKTAPVLDPASIPAHPPAGSDKTTWIHGSTTGHLLRKQYADGKGTRNIIVVAHLVECAHHVAREVVHPFREQAVHLIGFSGCYPNAYAGHMMKQLCTHPNVSGVLLVSLRCESFDRNSLAKAIRESDRPVHTVGIQNSGGTRKSIDEGREWVRKTCVELEAAPRVPMRADELVVGTICGGSDATSGITANPGIGRAFDKLVANNATAIFEETGELIGCEQIMAGRAATKELGVELLASVEKAAKYYTILGHGSFAVGNADGGLTGASRPGAGFQVKE